MVNFRYIQHFIFIFLSPVIFFKRCSTTKHYVNKLSSDMHTSLDLNTYLPGWTYYKLEDEESKYRIDSHNVLHWDLQDRVEPCVYLLKKYGSEDTYLSGKLCLVIKNNKISVLSNQFELYQRTPYIDTSVNLKTLFFDSFKALHIACKDINTSYYSLSKQYNLRISRHILKNTKLKVPLHCVIESTNSNNNIKRINLNVNFNKLFQVLPHVRKRRDLDNIEFEQSFYRVSVKENVDVGYKIETLKVSGGSGEYIITKNADTKTDILFSITTSGDLKVQEKLNREEGATQFTIDVTAADKNDPLLTSQATVVVTIIDVNDNPPVFSKSKYTKTIIEEEPADRFVLTVLATDEDEGVNKDLIYSIIKNSAVPCPFKINPTSGIITNSELLDREEKQVHIFKVKAQDKGVDPGSLSAEALVEITLADKNDNKPVFKEEKYAVSMFENTTVGTTILTVTATDTDAGDNGAIQYQPLSIKTFRIDSLTGDVILNQAVDYDRYQRFFTFSVVAFDRGLTPNYANVVVEIVVEDVNDNIPLFTRRSFRTTRPVMEDVENGTMVYKVVARDRDSGRFGKIKYKIASDAPKDLPFVLDSKSGEIFVSHLLDYEIQREYRFDVISEDGGSPPNNDKASVTILIGNINDNPPRFEQNAYNIELSEDTSKGSVILTVKAVDPDKLSIEDFEYSVVEGDPEQCFQIDPFAGTLILMNCDLDYKKQRQYKLKLQVIDSDSLAGYTYIVMNVFDANNNAPTFKSRVNIRKVSEDVKVGSCIGFVTATDDDSGENSRISYSIESNDFTINETTGELCTKSKLDRETKVSYQMVIKAEDHGKPSSKSGTATAVVQVTDVNDNTPTFQQDSYRKEILESHAVGDIVLGVTAVDTDDGVNKEIRYSLQPSGDGSIDAFAITADTGMITTKTKLDRETKASYILKVVATDQGEEIQLNSTVFVYIDLEDVADSDPVFDHKIYNFTIDENKKADVGVVHADLADEKFKHMLSYQIIDKTRNFRIDRKRGVILTQEPLDYESVKEYTFKVRVTSGSSGATDEAKVIIYVNDVNDHPPELSDFYIFLNIIDGRFNPIFQVPATDRDVTSKLRYSIISGNDHKFVQLNSLNGELKLEKSILNNNAEQVIKFEVKDSDFFARAYGRISVSEVSSEMISKSMFIVLYNTTRNSFLRSEILTKFKTALAKAFYCDSGRIFILSIEDFSIDDTTLPMLEIAVAVREEFKVNFLSDQKLKNLLYLNQQSFEKALGIKIVSFDYWNDRFCSAESCRNFEDCTVSTLNDTSASSTIKSHYVIFRGISIQRGLHCKCNDGYRNGPDQSKGLCSDVLNMCYKKPCGNNGKCISTDGGGFTCQCNPGYQGKLCHIDMRKSSCPGTSILTSLKSNPCENNGKCVNKLESSGFECECDNNDNADKDLCTLSSRYFPKSSFIVMQGLTQRWNLSLTLEFSTYEANAVLLYNGRYTNANDFVALEIIHSQVVFTVSLGEKDNSQSIHQVKSYVAGGVNDGQWHVVKVNYNNKRIDIAVGASCDLSSSYLLNPYNNQSYCSASKKIQDTMKSLDLSAPLLIGGLPNIGKDYLIKKKDFIGCLQNIKIDHLLLDLSTPIADHLTQPKCPQMKSECENNNTCKVGDCIDGLNGHTCECPVDKVGQFCQDDISLSSPSITLTSDSEIIKLSSFGTEAGYISSTKQPSTILVSVKTTQKDSVILEQEVDGMKAYLKISEGYVVYIFDTLELKLTSCYIANGKWHHIKVVWASQKLTLSTDYEQHSKTYDLYRDYSSIKLVSFNGKDDEAFVGCIQGVFINTNPIKFTGENIKSGCQSSDICKTEANTCGAHGQCNNIYGSVECNCDQGYSGPTCVDICMTNPCKNEAYCMKVNDGADFKCVCPANYTGELCESEMKSQCDEGYYGDPTVGLCGPCTCKVYESYDAVCDKDGTREVDSFPGNCFCKDRFFNHKGTCQSCDCLSKGSQHLVCDKATGQCPCLPGVIGQKCDQCPGAWQELTSQCNEINTSCPKTYTEGIWWNRVPPGATKQASCPRGANGTATRYCHIRNSWSPPNLFGCISSGFVNVKAVTDSILQGKETLSDKLAVSLSHLLLAASKISDRQYGKDIEIGYNALKLLIAFEGNKSAANMVSSEDDEFVTNILYSTSNLFKVTVKQFWQAIQKKYAGTAGLMQEMEKFVSILATNLHYVKRSRNRRSILTLTAYSQAEENLYLEIQPINLLSSDSHMLPKDQSDWSFKYAVWSENTVSVILPNNLFKGNDKVINNQISVGMVIYKTLGELLPSVCDFKQSGNNLAYTIDVMSDVVTMTIPGVDKNVRFPSNEEIQIVFKGAKINSSDYSSLTCAFWNYSNSQSVSGGWSRGGCRTILDNTSDVTCACNHLTTFALIKIRYTERIPQYYEIDILTYIGIGVTMLLLLLVFLIYFLLGQLKSNFNSIHKNLALVAFLTLLIFVVGVNRPLVGVSLCRIIAISIQYFITCTFSWLLVESLHMYRMILEPRDINYGQMMFYYFIGWGAPVMVVGVTAGLKAEGYGNQEFCWISIRDSSENLWTYFAPIMAIIAGNILLMTCAITSSCETQNNQKKRLKISAIRYRILISIVLIPLVGATVCLALIVVNYSEDLYKLMFPGFCILQGLYILVFYALLNRKVRREMYNAYIRRKTGDKTFGIKPRKKRTRPAVGRFMSGEQSGLMSDEYKRTLEAFNVNISDTTVDSSETEGRRKARRRVAGSETTDFQTTTQMDSSDSSDDDTFKVRRPTIDSDSSEDSGDEHDGKKEDGKKSVEWKVANQKKIIKRTYASDGPMHSTPSESDASDRQRWQRVGFTPTRVGGPELSVIQSESDPASVGTKKNGSRPAPPVKPSNKQQQSSTTGTDSDETSQRKKPVGILKKKSSYDGHRLRVRVKDSTKKPLMSLDDTAEFNDSQV